MTKNLKAKVFGLNVAKLFRVDIETKRKDVSKDYLSHIKMAYLGKGLPPVSPPMVGYKNFTHREFDFGFGIEKAAKSNKKQFLES